jgi:hypothetical protein
MTHKNGNSYCRGRSKSGESCRAAATASGLCFFHSNPDKASELGRIGGRSKRKAVAEDVDPLPKLETASAVRDALAQLIADVYAGKLEPRIASGLAPLISLQLRAIEAADVDVRLAKIEKQLAEKDQANESLEGVPRNIKLLPSKVLRLRWPVWITRRCLDSLQLRTSSESPQLALAQDRDRKVQKYQQSAVRCLVSSYPIDEHTGSSRTELCSLAVPLRPHY